MNDLSGHKDEVYSYNVPEFCVEPIRQSVKDLSRMIEQDAKQAEKPEILIGQNFPDIRQPERFLPGLLGGRSVYLIETGKVRSHKGDKAYSQWDKAAEEFNNTINTNEQS